MLLACFCIENYDAAFVIKELQDWLDDLNSPAGNRWLSSTVASNRAMMHTLMMDLQKIILASWQPFLHNNQYADRVGTDAVITYKETWQYARPTIDTVKHCLRSALAGVDGHYEKPAKTYEFFTARSTSTSNLSPPTNSRTARPAPTPSAQEVRPNTRQKTEGLISCSVQRPKHFPHSFSTFDGKSMCTNFVTYNMYCPRGARCQFAHFKNLRELNEEDRNAMIAWVNRTPEVSWRPNKGPSPSPGNTTR